MRETISFGGVTYAVARNLPYFHPLKYSPASIRVVLVRRDYNALHALVDAHPHLLLALDFAFSDDPRSLGVHYYRLTKAEVTTYTTPFLNGDTDTCRIFISEACDVTEQVERVRKLNLLRATDPEK